MPSAANGKSDKPSSSEATDNSPIRQIMVIIEHKIRNLEKRKSKLISYRDLQKSGKELNADQKVAVAKYDEVAQTLEFARDMGKQVSSIATTAEREARKQAKKDAWVRTAAETSKLREVLLIMDCLVQMGHSPAREDFLNGTNGAAKLTEQDLKILDDLYPEVTPKHESNEEGLPAFHIQATKAAEHLHAIIDGKPKEVLGTTYAHIKDIVLTVHQCGYFDKGAESEMVREQEPLEAESAEEAAEVAQAEVEAAEGEVPPVYAPPPVLAGPSPVPPAPAVVPAPVYPLCPLPPITLQEVEHAYFSQQYAQQQRPITEVIGSQNFFFLQESEIESPAGTPQPLPILNQPSPPGPIPTQTFTNQCFVPTAGARIAPDAAALPVPQPHFIPAAELAPYAAPLLPPPSAAPELPPPEPAPTAARAPHAAAPLAPPHAAPRAAPPAASPERDAAAQAQGDGPGQRYRRYGRNGSRGQTDGYRGRPNYQGRQVNDGYPNRQNGDGYQGRQNSDGYRGRQNNEGYQNRQNSSDGYQARQNDTYPNRQNDDGYYRNGESGNGHQRNENGGSRDRYDSSQSYQGGYKGRGRGGGRGGARGARGAGQQGPYPRKQMQSAE